MFAALNFRTTTSNTLGASKHTDHSMFETKVHMLSHQGRHVEGQQPKRKEQQGLIWEEASYTTLLNIHALKHQINQARLLHTTDITEEISSFGGTINSSLQQLYTGLSLGRPAGLIPSTSQAYLNCPSSSRNTEKQPPAQQHFHTEPHTNFLQVEAFESAILRIVNGSQVMLMGDMRGINTAAGIWTCMYAYMQCRNIYLSNIMQHIRQNVIHKWIL